MMHSKLYLKSNLCNILYSLALDCSLNTYTEAEEPIQIFCSELQKWVET